MIFWTLFTLSVLLNTFFIWYTRVMLSKFNFLSDNLDDLIVRVNDGVVKEIGQDLIDAVPVKRS